MRIPTIPPIAFVAFVAFAALPALAGVASCGDARPRATTIDARAHALGPEDRIPMTNAVPGAGGAIRHGAVASLRAPASVPGVAAAPDGDARTLVLYDDGGAWGWLGELYAAAAGTLASHFGAWSAEPISKYRSGEMGAYSAVIYVGSTFDQSIPIPFFEDVLAGRTPVIWLGDNVWQLADSTANFDETYGFVPDRFDDGAFASVEYKGVALARDPANDGGVMTYSTLDASKATTLATAKRADGSAVAWAIRARNLTYVGENPFTYLGMDDRYLAFCDLLFDALAPGTPERHRALVRIEDVDPMVSPAALRAIADTLASLHVPFAVATIPVYRDPRGVYDEGVPQTAAMHEVPQAVDALKYALARGGALVLHGYSHQYADVENPYTGATGDDVEFFRAHVDATNRVVWDGPVAEDAPAWVDARLAQALGELAIAGLPAPRTFELPHYAGSPVDARAVRARFARAYHREVFFGGVLTGGAPRYDRSIGLFFPYVVRDPFGLTVLPEDLGCYSPDAVNHNPPRLPADILASARRERVVRDGFASFFFHPYYDVARLREIVTGLQALGFTFVSPDSL